MEKITRAQFARLMGVKRSTVTRWVQAGRIELDAHGMIDPEEAKRSLGITESPLPHHQANIARIEAEKAEKAMDASSQYHGMGEGKEAVSMRLKLAMAKEREAKAELAAMERDRMAGLLVERAEMEFVMRDLGATLRASLESLPDRMAPVLAGHHGNVNAIHASLQDAMHTLLLEISDMIHRKAEVRA